MTKEKSFNTDNVAEALSVVDYAVKEAFQNLEDNPPDAWREKEMVNSALEEMAEDGTPEPILRRLALLYFALCISASVSLAKVDAEEVS